MQEALKTVKVQEEQLKVQEVEANLEAGQSKLGEDFGSGLEVVDLKETLLRRGWRSWRASCKGRGNS